MPQNLFGREVSLSWEQIKESPNCRTQAVPFRHGSSRAQAAAQQAAAVVAQLELKRSDRTSLMPSVDGVDVSFPQLLQWGGSQSSSPRPRTPRSTAPHSHKLQTPGTPSCTSLPAQNALESCILESPVVAQTHHGAMQNTSMRTFSNSPATSPTTSPVLERSLSSPRWMDTQSLLRPCQQDSDRFLHNWRSRDETSALHGIPSPRISPQTRGLSLTLQAWNQKFEEVTKKNISLSLQSFVQDINQTARWSEVEVQKGQSFTVDETLDQKALPITKTSTSTRIAQSVGNVQPLLMSPGAEKHRYTTGNMDDHRKDSFICWQRDGSPIPFSGVDKDSPGRERAQGRDPVVVQLREQILELEAQEAAAIIQMESDRSMRSEMEEKIEDLQGRLAASVATLTAAESQHRESRMRWQNDVNDRSLELADLEAALVSAEKELEKALLAVNTERNGSQEREQEWRRAQEEVAISEAKWRKSRAAWENRVEQLQAAGYKDVLRRSLPANSESEVANGVLLSGNPIRRFLSDPVEGKRGKKWNARTSVEAWANCEIDKFVDEDVSPRSSPLSVRSTVASYQKSEKDELTAMQNRIAELEQQKAAREFARRSSHVAWLEQSKVEMHDRTMQQEAEMDRLKAELASARQEHSALQEITKESDDFIDMSLEERRKSRMNWQGRVRDLEMALTNLELERDQSRAQHQEHDVKLKQARTMELESATEELSIWKQRYVELERERIASEEARRKSQGAWAERLNAVKQNHEVALEERRQSHDKWEAKVAAIEEARKAMEAKERQNMAQWENRLKELESAQAKAENDRRQSRAAWHSAVSVAQRGHTLSEFDKKLIQFSGTGSRSPDFKSALKSHQVAPESERNLFAKEDSVVQRLERDRLLAKAKRQSMIRMQLQENNQGAERPVLLEVVESDEDVGFVDLQEDDDDDFNVRKLRAKWSQRVKRFGNTTNGDKRSFGSTPSIDSKKSKSPIAGIGNSLWAPAAQDDMQSRPSIDGSRMSGSHHAPGPGTPQRESLVFDLTDATSNGPNGSHDVIARSTIFANSRLSLSPRQSQVSELWSPSMPGSQRSTIHSNHSKSERHVRFTEGVDGNLVEPDVLLYSEPSSFSHQAFSEPTFLHQGSEPESLPPMRNTVRPEDQEPEGPFIMFGSEPTFSADVEHRHTIGTPKVRNTIRMRGTVAEPDAMDLDDQDIHTAQKRLNQTEPSSTQAPFVSSFPTPFQRDFSQVPPTVRAQLANRDAEQSEIPDNTKKRLDEILGWP